MTYEFVEFCANNHILLVLRTKYNSHAIQFEDLVNFWVLKNARDVGWYKVKQQAIITELYQTGGKSSALNHAKQLKLLVPCWNNAFSQETNATAVSTQDPEPQTSPSPLSSH